MGRLKRKSIQKRIRHNKAIADALLEAMTNSVKETIETTAKGIVSGTPHKSGAIAGGNQGNADEAPHSSNIAWNSWRLGVDIAPLNYDLDSGSFGEEISSNKEKADKYGSEEASESVESIDKNLSSAHLTKDLHFYSIAPYMNDLEAAMPGSEVNQGFVLKGTALFPSLLRANVIKHNQEFQSKKIKG
ncbi:hypothetical protein [Photobacterium leiognathi]|uniref:hypothetical protein n=1 Tax=Photobacterium leiognathi TaxID=553611 RepID=UPI002981D215|nr:hypothetical protein [Photobacterium leiognathi]